MLSVNTGHLKRIRPRDLTSHDSDEMDILVTTLKLYDIRFGIVESICKEDFKNITSLIIYYIHSYLFSETI